MRVNTNSVLFGHVMSVGMFVSPLLVCMQGAPTKILTRQSVVAKPLAETLPGACAGRYTAPVSVLLMPVPICLSTTRLKRSDYHV